MRNSVFYSNVGIYRGQRFIDCSAAIFHWSPVFSFGVLVSGLSQGWTVYMILKREEVVGGSVDLCWYSQNLQYCRCALQESVYYSGGITGNRCAAYILCAFRCG